MAIINSHQSKNKMYTQTISHKFQLLNKEYIMSFVSGSLDSLLTDSSNIINYDSPQLSKYHEIKYFKFRDAINGYANLQENWDSYNANPVSNNSIEISLEVLNYLLFSGILSKGIYVNVFPMRDGGIQFEFDGDNICAELEINQNGELTFIQFDCEGNIIKEQQLFELLELSILLKES